MLKHLSRDFKWYIIKGHIHFICMCQYYSDGDFPHPSSKKFPSCKSGCFGFKIRVSSAGPETVSDDALSYNDGRGDDNDMMMAMIRW